MNPFEDYYFLGKIIRPHGYHGKVSAYLDTDEPEMYSSLSVVFIKKDGIPVPFFITNIHILNNKAVIEFKDIDTFDKAEALSQKELYLPLSTLPKLSGNRFYYHEIENYKVIDVNQGEIGIVSEVLDYSTQALLKVIKDNIEILIPVNNQIIKHLDRDKKEIHVETPEGLIELYLKG